MSGIKDKIKDVISKPKVKWGLIISGILIGIVLIIVIIVVAMYPNGKGIGAYKLFPMKVDFNID